MQPITILLPFALIFLEVLEIHGGSSSRDLTDAGQYNTTNTFNKGSEGRIVGGSEATKGEFPWIVLLKLDNINQCAGSILSPDWIVTSTYCARLGTANRWTVVAGEHTRDLADGSEQVRSVSQILEHPNFTDSWANNVALMKLSSPLVLGQYVNAAVIPETDFSPGTDLVVAGWGKTTDNCNDNDLSWHSTLHKATVTLYPELPCHIGGNKDGNICARGNGGDFSWGDLGGPLHSGRYLVGTAITNWCGPDSSVYSYLPYFLSWIRSNTNIPTPTTTTTPPTTTIRHSDFICKEDGLFVDPCDCQVFHVCDQCLFETCQHNTLKCPDSLIFCEGRQYCDYRGSCACDNSSCPPT